ncbi:MAG TPA: nucleotidyl transferase AbiEii/AbiGii toxin family protein [Solirubrobacterales bacterium]|nr:nucleotidyl transferase AbiEii/AbiGii toxin family protein [Solirubrobacterales bacterium]
MLRDWVRDYADSTDQVVGRVTRAISFMLVTLALERAQTDDGGPLFLVKGGVSMELRLNLRARTTKDLDTVFRGQFGEWLDALDDALAGDIDELSFSRSEPADIPGAGAFRVDVAIDFKGRRWGQVQLEVAPAEAEAVLDVDEVEAFDIGQFGLPSPGRIKVVSLPYLIAQKLHACTEPPMDGRENQRVHDLIDLLLARDLLEQGDLERVREACIAIFAGRATHEWPPELVVFPRWRETFAKLATEENFPIADVAQAAELVRGLIVEIEEAPPH